MTDDTPEATASTETTYDPLVCIICGEQVVLTQKDDDPVPIRYECDCDTRSPDVKLPDTWVTATEAVEDTYLFRCGADGHEWTGETARPCPTCGTSHVFVVEEDTIIPV